MKESNSFTLEISETDKICPVGEKAGSRYREEGKIPVLSCEGACIRGEIARLAANLVAKKEPYRRGCHGELFTVPPSELAQWIKNAGKIVLVDGCFLRCHGRILENLVGRENLVQFDALSFYGRYTDLFDIDSVPEAERKETARIVADIVLAELKKMPDPGAGSRTETGCGAVATGAAPEPAAVSGCGCS
jgi:DGC domain-containing protein